MNYKDVLNIEKENGDVYLGYNEDKICKINVFKDNSIIITGSTGTSKSVLLNQILLQVIKDKNPNEVKIYTINQNRVELQLYKDSKYGLNHVEGSMDVLTNLIDKRLEQLEESNCKNICEYNKQNKNQMEYIIIAIDEASDILKEKSNISMVNKIIKYCDYLGLILILDTNDVYNDFFEKDYNMRAKCRISFDFVCKEDSKVNNLRESENLHLKEFIIYSDDYKNEKYMTYEYDDSIVKEVLDK